MVNGLALLHVSIVCYIVIQAKFRWFTAFRVVVSQSVNPQLSCSLSACYLKMGNCYIVHYQRSLLGIEKP
jgi:hypothetical protein